MTPSEAQKGAILKYFAKLTVAMADMGRVTNFETACKRANIGPEKNNITAAIMSWLESNGETSVAGEIKTPQINSDEYYKLLLADIIGKDKMQLAPDLQYLQITRLSQCLRMIPDNLKDDYVKLSIEYHWLAENPDAGLHDPSTATIESIHRIMRFLKEPSRIEYITTGVSDLQQAFNQEEIEALNSMGIYVLNDMLLFKEESLLNILVSKDTEPHFHYQIRKYMESQN